MLTRRGKFFLHAFHCRKRFIAQHVRERGIHFRKNFIGFDNLRKRRRQNLLMGLVEQIALVIATRQGIYAHGRCRYNKARKTYHAHTACGAGALLFLFRRSRMNCGNIGGTCLAAAPCLCRVNSGSHKIFRKTAGNGSARNGVAAQRDRARGIVLNGCRRKFTR